MRAVAVSVLAPHSGLSSPPEPALQPGHGLERAGGSRGSGLGWPRVRSPPVWGKGIRKRLWGEGHSEGPKPNQ